MNPVRCRGKRTCMAIISAAACVLTWTGPSNADHGTNWFYGSQPGNTGKYYAYTYADDEVDEAVAVYRNDTTGSQNGVRCVGNETCGITVSAQISISSGQSYKTAHCAADDPHYLRASGGVYPDCLDNGIPNYLLTGTIK